MPNIFMRYRAQWLGAVLCLGLGMISGILGDSGPSPWYLSLQRSSLTPPSFVFPIVWTALYIMMGVALGIIWQIRQTQDNLLNPFILQFALNMAWSPLFFYMHRIDLALYVLIALLTCLTLFMIRAWKVRMIFWLMLPYYLWSCFAYYLNMQVWQLNGCCGL